MPDDIRPPVSNKSHRVRMGVALGLLLIASILMGGWFWAAFVSAYLFFGFQELTVIMQALNVSPSKLIVLVMGGLMVITSTLGLSHILPTLATLAVIFSFFRLLFRDPRGKMGDIGATLLALFYVAYFPVHFIMLRQLGAEGLTNPLDQPGWGYLMMVMWVIGGSDIGAYYIGKAFGKEPLHAELSPKKTKEGAIGGILVGIAVGMGLAYYTHFPLHHAFILSILLVITGQLGDLTESLFKREAGVKDSGQIFQGHGGILDRGDSYVFSGAVSYYYIYWFVLHQGFFESMLNFFHSGFSTLEFFRAGGA